MNDLDEESKLPFARKYRPKTNDEYAGNDSVKEKFIKRVTANPAQVILLWGDSGCGKTTYGRIGMKEYRCLNRDPIKGACNCCESCREIDAYIESGSTDALDYIKEIDIASNRGVNEINNFLSDIEIPAFDQRHKFYLLDECHMATESAQNALLKVTEEPPKNVVFIFCTTNRERMLPTLLNRCQLQLHVTKPTVKELSGVLANICYKENIKYDAKGLNLISNRSDLVFREAVNSLEQISAEQGDVTYSSVLKALDELANSDLFEFFRSLLNQDVMTYVNLLCKIKEKIDLKVFVQRLLEFTKRGIKILNNVPLDGMTEGEIKSYKELFMSFSTNQIATLIQKLLDMSVNDTEVKLILMGYTGLTESASSISETSSLESMIIPPDKEKMLESKAEAVNAEIRSNPTQEQLEKTLDTLTKEGTAEDVLSIFSGNLLQK